MHRHMRIHEKEMAAASVNGTPQPPATPPSNFTHAKPPKNLKKKKEGHKDTLLVPKVVPQAENALPKPEPANILKRHLESPGQSESGPSPPKRPATSEESVDIKEEVEDLDQAEVAAAAPYVELLKKAPGKEGSDGQYECPICQRRFLCSYGLDIHMDVHGSQSSLIPRCHACHMTFCDSSSLHQHNLRTHMQQRDQRDDTHPSTEIGFHELQFMPFSCEKFPVVAKAFCERHQRQSCSEFHDFTCQRCSHAFPCASALKLHREAHAPEFPSTCTICDVVYGTRHEFYQHMTSHSQQEVVANYLKLKGTDDNAIQDAMSKEEFLLVLGLKVKRVESRSFSFGEVARSVVPVKEELKDNQDYFVKLGLIRPQKPKTSSAESKNDFAEITKILTRVNAMSPQVYRYGSSPSPQPTTPFAKAASHSVLPNLPLFAQNDAYDASEDKTTDEEDGMCASKLTAESPDKEDKEGPFTCKYCDEVFTNYRVYKGISSPHLCSPCSILPEQHT